MRIGLSLHLQKSLDGTWDDAYSTFIESARYADEHGYRNIWMVEHHFMDHTTPSPSVVLSHLAAITRRIRLGYSVCLLPFHHPLRIAEEMLLLDRLSNGRADLGVGRGHTPIEVATLSPDPDKSVEMFNDAVRILKLAFKGEAFAFQGEYWNFPEVQLFPPPVQRDVTLMMPITSPRSIEFAAQNGIAPLLGNRVMQELKDTLDAFVHAAEAAGQSGDRIEAMLDKSAITRVCVINDSFGAAEEAARREIAQYHHGFVLNGVPVGDPRFPRIAQEWPPIDDPVDAITPRRALLGTPSDIVDQLREFERTGIQNVTLGMGSYITPYEERRRRLRQFTEEVLPHVQNIRLVA